MVGAAAAATAELDVAVADVDREPARQQDAQVEVEERTAASGWARLAEPAAAGVVPPPASAAPSVRTLTPAATSGLVSADERPCAMTDDTPATDAMTLRPRTVSFERSTRRVDSPA